MRTALRSSARPSIILLTLLAVTACEVTVEGTPRFDAGQGASPDASVLSDGGVQQGGDGGGSWVACDPLTLPNGDGKHNAGQACMSCHGAGGMGPLFTLGGTAYTDALGTAPAAGATIRVRSANNQEFELVTASNGNFWTTQPLAFPLLVASSTCPTVLPMGPPVELAGADCNRAGCHSGGNRIPVSQ